MPYNEEQIWTFILTLFWEDKKMKKLEIIMFDTIMAVAAIAMVALFGMGALRLSKSNATLRESVQTYRDAYTHYRSVSIEQARIIDELTIENDTDDDKGTFDKDVVSTARLMNIK